VPQLALDQRQWDALVLQLNSMRMPELMRGHPTAHTRLDRDAMQLEPGGASRQAAHVRARRSRRTAGRWQLRALGQPWLQRFPRPRVHADLAAAIVRCVPDANRSASLIQIGLR
jgi:hypothetical protein